MAAENALNYYYNYYQIIFVHKHIALRTSSKLYADLPEYCNTEIFETFRPDVAVLHNNTVHVLELTCCHELNLESSHDFEQTKYLDLELYCIANLKVCVYYLQ